MKKLQIPIFQVDAFTGSLFKGNPAAVCPLETWLPEHLMQTIAAENNLSETAFICNTDGAWRIRWFTPTTEVNLCGHATLASAYVMFNFMNYKDSVITFESKSGPLKVSKKGDSFELDFPIRRIKSCEPTCELLSAIPSDFEEICLSGDQAYLVVLKSEQTVRSFTPDFVKLSKVDRSVNITARGLNHDFVSRFFAPNHGIPEDPVTGSAHCGLAVYWSQKFKKTGKLSALQLSQRTGELICEVVGDRVLISGQAVLYLQGVINCP